MLYPQHEAELAELCGLIRSRGVRSILEIGSRDGTTLVRMASEMPPVGSRVVSVDLPGALWGRGDSEQKLRANIARLESGGYDVRLILGDSHDAAIVAQVQRLGPFDMVFIDGDHTLEGVITDWHYYGPLGRMVAFHDIHPALHRKLSTHGDRTVELGVPEFWAKLKQAYPLRHVEFLAPEQPPLGIGVIFRGD